MITSSMYYYTTTLEQLFVETEFTSNSDSESINFEGISTINDFWAYLESTMIESLYFSSSLNVTESEISGKDKKILNENKLLGVPRLRQVRVTNHSCTIPDEFKRTFSTCYDAYSPDAEDTLPFGPENQTAWTYTKLGGIGYWGVLAKYGGGGYYVDLPTIPEETTDTVKNLKENLWITRATRAVFLDFTVYNANINLFCIIKLVFEFPPTGGVMTSHVFQTVKLIRYATDFDNVVKCFEFVFIAFTVFYTIEEFRELISLRFLYFTDCWNVLDLTKLVISYVCIAFSFYRYNLIEDKLDHLIQHEKEYPNFETLGFWEMQYNIVIAIFVFFVWIKLFKYLSFNRTMTQLSRTLSQCAKDIAGFGVMFFIVFLAYAQLGYLLFGSMVKDFNGIDTSVFTLLRTILGDFDYEAIHDANRILGPIFFLTYIFFVFFVLLNMFLAIINDTYAEVKSEIAFGKDQVEITHYLKKWCKCLLAKIGIKCGDKEKSKEDGPITYNDIREILRKCNFTDLEIEMFFAKYEIKGDRVVTEEDTKKMLTDLGWTDQDESEGGHDRRHEGSEISREEFDQLKRRLENIEEFIEKLSIKVTTVLERLEGLRKRR